MDDGKTLLRNVATAEDQRSVSSNNENQNPRHVQYGGNHYINWPIQPIEFITANRLGFCEGNIIKYVSRFRDKGGKEDLIKAKHYIDILIEQEYGDTY